MVYFNYSSEEIKQVKKWLSILLASVCGMAFGSEIVCGEQRFSGHLQGIAADDTGIYWSFVDTVVKTDCAGKMTASVTVPRHAGDLCAADGLIYVSVCYYDKADIKRDGDTGWVYVYNDKLEFLRKIALPDTRRPDGITFCNGTFYVAGDDFGKTLHRENSIRVYSADWRYLRSVTVDIGTPTHYGAQTLNAVGGRILAGFYTKRQPNAVLLSVPELKPEGTFPVPVSFGFAVIPKKFSGNRELYMVARTTGNRKNGTAGGKVVIYEMRDGKYVPAEWNLPVNNP